MKFGIKLWSTNKDLIKIARKHFLMKEFDYIEISAIIGTYDEEYLSQIKGIPCIIHFDNNDVDISRGENYGNNIKAIKEAQKFADFLDPKHIIIHPGHTGNIENVNNILSKFKDKRFCIENMPGMTVYNEKSIATTYDELKSIKCDKYCLDISHAIKSAITQKKGLYDNLKQLIKLNYIILHISDAKLDNEKDEHMDIGKGEYDFKAISKLLSGFDGYITLETPKDDFKSLDNDIQNIKKMKKFFK